MEIVPGPSSPLLASRIADKLGVKLSKTNYRVFPDGELYVRVGCKDSESVIVQSINSNNDLIFLLLLLDALEGKEISVVIPYMGYSRQDRVFHEGEALSVRAIARLIEGYSERVLSVNIHSKEARKHFKRLEEVDAMPVIGMNFADDDILMVAPDKGACEEVKRAAKVADCDFDYLEKTRLSSENVVMKAKNFNISGKKVVIVDDIISTGGTIIEATNMLVKSGAKEVDAVCVHPVLTNFALNRLYAEGVYKVIGTDTIEKPVSEITVAEIIADSF